MIGLEGTLMVPPERNQILGRPPWKPRYVTVARKEMSSKGSTSSGQPLPKLGRTNTLSEDYFLSVYKNQDDPDPIQEYPVAMITNCEVQITAHRKQGSVLPTMIVSITDKGKKRRSSRATGFMAGSKESSTFALLFRTPLDGHHPSLQDWTRAIAAAKSPSSGLDSPISPTFQNPFATRRDTADAFSARPPSGNALQHKTSNYTHSSRDPPTFSSDSPSLRSRKSDISSPSSHNHPSHTNTYGGPANYTSVLPCDMVASPDATTMADYPGDFIGGWTSAQGRSSRLGRDPGRGSVSSQPQSPLGEEPSSPAGPRETILDRAFQLRYVPGSETSVPGEEKLTSLARFDALMRDVDQKRRASEQPAVRTIAEQLQQSISEESDTERHQIHEADDEDDDDDDDDDEDDDDDDLYIQDHEPIIPATTQRALDFIASRRDMAATPRVPGSRAPVSFYHVSSLTRPHTLTAPLRPHTSHSRSRPSISSQLRSYSHISSPQTTPTTPTTVPPTPLDAPSLHSEDAGSSNSSRTAGNSAEKRTSSSSGQRLSFTEFTKRLSSTSSLLLVQTNASSTSSSNRNSDVEGHQLSAPAGKSRADAPASPSVQSGTWENDERCTGWRSSVIGASDGGFV